ncbi:hypothetical protein [Edaphobacter bradus]|uniref:hypothetical protein n=1 Tax=Edaphobacter bradus TaxID=2259016 RepID=UPI0021DFE3BD|nr:hypothetical protein [Edaphobacter bradus]
MRAQTSIRFLAAIGLSASALLCAQSRPTRQQPPAKTSTLPPAPQTATPPVTTAPAAPLTPAQSPARRAEVTVAAGQITVSAYNSSLNQILRDIARAEQIKITGGVMDERVFGDYSGPAGQVLAALLDGTSSNMLLVQGNGSTPTELILTPRTGGPTPPNPNAVRADDDDAGDLPPRGPVGYPQPSSEAGSSPAQPNPTPPSIPPANIRTGDTPSSSSPADSTQQQSPNGVKTPQQIYEDLQRLRQQQQQQQTNPQ